MRNGHPARGISELDLLASRCATCREVVDDREAVVNFGELIFHFGCSPGCNVCGRTLAAGEAGWRFEGEVVSEPFGWSVRPTRFWCRDCLDRSVRDRPVGID
jgi:hypothetical protein